MKLKHVIIAALGLFFLTSCEKESAPEQLLNAWSYSYRTEYYLDGNLLYKDAIYEGRSSDFKSYWFKKKGILIVGYEDYQEAETYKYDKGSGIVSIEDRNMTIHSLTDSELVLSEKVDTQYKRFDELRVYFKKMP